MRQTLMELRQLLAASYQLLGADHSRMVDDNAEAAHILIGRSLAYTDEALRGVVEDGDGKPVERTKSNRDERMRAKNVARRAGRSNRRQAVR